MNLEASVRDMTDSEEGLLYKQSYRNGLKCLNRM
jgi:hypothetical protein